MRKISVNRDKLSKLQWKGHTSLPSFARLTSLNTTLDYDRKTRSYSEPPHLTEHFPFAAERVRKDGRSNWTLRVEHVENWNPSFKSELPDSLATRQETKCLAPLSKSWLVNNALST